MKLARLAFCLVFAAVLAVSVSVSANAQPAAPMKIMFIDTSLFGEKDGINRYIAGLGTIEKELNPLQAEITTMGTRMNTLRTELAKMQEQAKTATGAARDTLIRQAQTSSDEYQLLDTQIKRKQEDGKARLERRRPEVLNPILKDIRVAMGEFARQKGYDVMLDISKLDPAILFYDEPKVDVTKAFIVFYNARTPK